MRTRMVAYFVLHSGYFPIDSSSPLRSNDTVAVEGVLKGSNSNSMVWCFFNSVISAVGAGENSPFPSLDSGQYCFAGFPESIRSRTVCKSVPYSTDAAEPNFTNKSGRRLVWHCTIRRGVSVPIHALKESLDVRLRMIVRMLSMADVSSDSSQRLIEGVFAVSVFGVSERGDAAIFFDVDSGVHDLIRPTIPTKQTRPINRFCGALDRVGGGEVCDRGVSSALPQLEQNRVDGGFGRLQPGQGSKGSLQSNSHYKKTILIP
jgi:hypothetical protein